MRAPPGVHEPPKNESTTDRIARHNAVYYQALMIARHTRRGNRGCAIYWMSSCGGTRTNRPFRIVRITRGTCVSGANSDVRRGSRGNRKKSTPSSISVLSRAAITLSSARWSGRRCRSRESRRPGRRFRGRTTGLDRSGRALPTDVLILVAPLIPV